MGAPSFNGRMKVVLKVFTSGLSLDHLLFLFCSVVRFYQTQMKQSARGLGRAECMRLESCFVWPAMRSLIWTPMLKRWCSTFDQVY